MYKNYAAMDLGMDTRLRNENSTGTSLRSMMLLLALLFSAVSVNAQVTKTVGGTGGADYTTLRAAFNAINAGTIGAGGAITLNIISNTTETASCILNSSGAGAANYASVLIQPIADGLTIDGALGATNGRGIIELNGADNVTINGDNPNTAGTNKNLSIIYSGTSLVTTSVIRIVTSTLITTANNITIRNCNLTGSAASLNQAANTTFSLQSTSNVIFAGGGGSNSSATSAPLTLSSDVVNSGVNESFANLVIDNNSLNNAGKGISIGGDSEAVCPVLTITNNIIGNPTDGADNQIYWRGISINGGFGSTVGSTISGNTIYVESYLGSGTAPYGPVGIAVGRLSSIASVKAQNGTFDSNRIMRVKQRNTGGFTAIGIVLNGGNGMTVKNNFIHGVINIGANSFISYLGAHGMLLYSGTGHKINHNTVTLFGTDPGSANLISCLAIDPNLCTGADVRNNIFSNNINASNGAASALVDIYLLSTPASSCGLIMNNNAYFVGPSPSYNGLAQIGSTKTASSYYLGSSFSTTTLASTNFRSVTSLATATNDNASFATNGFVPMQPGSPLLINNSSIVASYLWNKGALGTGVTTDIQGEARPQGTATFPTIGADEFAFCSAATGGTFSDTTVSTCAGSNLTISVTGASVTNGITYHWEVSTTPGSGFSTVSQTSGLSYTLVNPSAGIFYYRLRVTCPYGPATAYSNEVQVTINALPTITISPNVDVYCPQGAPVTLTASGATTYVWSGTGTPGLSSTTGTSITANPSTATLVTATGTNANGCINAGVANLLVTSNPTAPSTTSYSICAGATVPAGQGLLSTVPTLTGSQTIYLPPTFESPETFSPPGNVFGTGTMRPLPAGAIITSLTIYYQNIEARLNSRKSDVNLGLSGAIVNAAANDPLASNTAGLFNYSRTATTNITSTNSGGTVNLLYWDFEDNNPNSEAYFTFYGATVTINYSYPAAIKWYTTASGGNPIGTGTPFNPVGIDPALATTNVPGNYTYYAEVSYGACTSSRSAATLTVLPTPTATAGGNSPVCTSGALNLTGATNIGTSFAWTGPNGFASTAQNPSIANITSAATGLYTFTATTAAGCSSNPSSTMVVVNTTPDAVTITPSSATICSGTPVGLVASGGNIYTSATLGTITGATTPATTASTLGPNPLQSYYGGTKQQMIVSASELTALGLTSGSAINSVAFYLTNSENLRILQGIQVRISNTALNAFPNTTFAAAGTLVRTAANVTVAAGWNTLAFTSNYTWNGSSNLIIEVNYSNGDSGGVGVNTALYGSTPFASTLFFRADGLSAALVAAEPTAQFSYTQRNYMNIGFLRAKTVTWTPANSGLNVYTGTNVTATPTTTQTYTATATINGCSSAASATITVKTNYTIGASVGSAGGTITPSGLTTVCIGNSQSYTITANSGYHIASVLVNGLSQGAIGTYTFSNVISHHTITATFAPDCINVGLASASANTPTICTGATTTMSATGLTGTGAVVNWYTGSGGTGLNVGTGLTSNAVNPGTYYAYATGSCGPPIQITVTVNAFTPTTVTAGNVSGCAGSPIALVGSPAGGTFSVANPYTGPTTTYTYTYTNGNGCTATSAPANITVYDLPIVTAGNITGCAGSPIVLVGSPAGGTFSVANPYSGPTTTYTYTFTNANGCTVQSTPATITVNPLPTVTAGNVTGCAGSPIALIGSPAGGTFSVANPYTGPTTTYTYTYTNGNGCTATSTQATITVIPLPIVTAGNVSGCAGTPIALVGSPAGGTFSVANPYTGPTTTYTYTYTNANGCTVQSTPANITVNPIPATPTITVSGSTTFCAGGSVLLTASTGDNYLWSNGQTTQSITVTASGSYSVQLISSFACVSSSSIPLVVTATPQPLWYLDADNDHYYTGSVIPSCTSPGPGYTTSGLLGGNDCNDSNIASYPGATEICWNGILENCSGTLSQGCAPVVVNMTPSYHNTTLTSLSVAVPAVAYTYLNYSNLKYRFSITNVTTNTTAPDIIQTSRYVTIPASIHLYGAAYDIKVSAVINNEVVPFAGNTIRVNGPLVQPITLNTISCGATLATLATTLTANAGLNATGYIFRIRLNDANPSPTYAYSQSATRFVGANTFTSFPLQYGTSYKVSVQYTFTDPLTSLPVQSGYGAECTVNTPSIPLLSIASPTCGSQVATMNSNISAQAAPYATGYQFRIRLFSDNGPTPTYYYTAVNPSRFSSLTAFTALPIAYNTAYSISVQYSVSSASGTVWSGYGAECKVTTSFFPTTSLVPSQCGLATPTSLTQQLNITPYPGFPHYMVKLDELGDGEDIVDSQEIEITYSYFRLNQFSIAQRDKNYNVSVAIKLNNVFGDYSTACDLFTAPLGKTVTVIPFKATAYPNPFANTFMLDVKTASQSSVNLKVYDMVGRLIEQREVSISDIQTMTIGDRYPAGVYNVVVSQEDTVQTLRVIKR